MPMDSLGEDLIDFSLKLSNPSSIAQQQKLELISTRFDIAGKVPEGMVDKRWVRKNVLGLTDEDILAIDEGMIEDAAAAAELEAAGAAPDTGGGGGDEGGGDLFAADIKDDADLLDGNPITADESSMREADDDDSEEDLDEDEIVKLSMDDEDGPVKVDNMVRNMWGEPLQKSRKETNSAGKIHSPDFASMTGVGSKTRQRDSMNRPYDRDFLKNPFGEGLIADLEKDGNFGESANNPRFNPSTVSLLSKLSKVISNNQSSLLKEEESGIDLEIIDENLTANNVLSEDDDEA